MQHQPFTSAETTVALALAAGIAAQVLARHLRIPSIVLLLGVGVLLGPDVANLVVPDQMGDGLLSLVGFAVAVILFEGGMNLQLNRLRRENRAIRQLVTIGALVTLVGASLCARWVLAWDWIPSILFGTLVIVTGPTVITPLLRRFRVDRRTATVLEAEGVLIDAVGAVVAVVALEVALTPDAVHVAMGLANVPLTLGLGGLIGVAGGFGMAGLLRVHGVVPDGLENVFTLSMVLAIFQISNVLLPESGIAAATAAGIVVGNSKSLASRELFEFKEQLTVMFIGMLFVLLAADVRLANVRALGWPGLLTVGLLILVVRPLNVFIGTLGTELQTRQKVFIAAIGPRGIVAAAVAAFFAAELKRAGMEGGHELRAMVFMVIVVSVISAALSGSVLGRLLGLSRPTGSGWVILGANELARTMARCLSREGSDVVCIDTNPMSCKQAEKDGLRVIYGNGMREGVLARAGIDTRAGALAMTSNTEVNLLFLQRVREEAKGIRVAVGVGKTRAQTSTSMLTRSRGEVLFGGVQHLDSWMVSLRVGKAQVERFTAQQEVRSPNGGFCLGDAPDGLMLPLTIRTGDKIQPVGSSLERIRLGETLDVVIPSERAQEAALWLQQRHLIHSEELARPLEPTLPPRDDGRDTKDAD